MRRAGRAIAVALGVGALALLLAEGVARVLLPRFRPARAERALFWQPHPLLGWVHRPGAEGRFRGPDWDVHVSINEHGLRDEPHAPGPPPPGRRRVLLLSDSFGWGFGVEREAGVAERLEARCPELEVVNASVSGWSTDQEYLWYREAGAAWAPHRVLLLIHANDMEGSSFDRYYGYPKPRFVLAGDGLELTNVPVPERPLPTRLWAALVSRTFLGNAARLAFPRLSVWLEGPPYLAEDGPPIRPEVTRRLLLRFAAELEAAGVDFTWALVSMDPRLADFYARTARAAGVDLVDLGPAFQRAEAEGAQLWLPGDPHWNAAGHDLAARRLAEALGCGAPRS